MTRYLASALALAAFLIIVGLVFIRADTVLAPSLQDSTSSASSTVAIGGYVIRVSVADTETTRHRGLSGSVGLAEGEGMLFIFPKDGTYGFWMKDMKFPIDIIWLSSDRIIVSMAQNVSPDTYPRVFNPKVPARYVLELPAGYAKAYTVDVGDEVRF